MTHTLTVNYDDNAENDVEFKEACELVFGDEGQHIYITITSATEERKPYNLDLFIDDLSMDGDAKISVDLKQTVIDDIKDGDDNTEALAIADELREIAREIDKVVYQRMAIDNDKMLCEMVK